MWAKSKAAATVGEPIGEGRGVGRPAGRAADAYRKLADVDRRFRTEYLTSVAKLEARLGRATRPCRPAATCSPPRRATPSTTSSSPTSASSSARPTRALTPSAARSASTRPSRKVLLTLAEALADQFRTDEAIELYWRAFEKSADLDGKLGIVIAG